MTRSTKTVERTNQEHNSIITLVKSERAITDQYMLPIMGVSVGIVIGAIATMHFFNVI